MADTKFIKKINLGTASAPDNYDLAALALLDELGAEHSYEDIVALIGKGLQIVIDEKSTTKDEPKTAPSAATMGKLYLVQLATQVISGTYTEFITLENPAGVYAWEKIGTTAVDLSAYALKTEAGKAGTYTSSSETLTTDQEDGYNAEVILTNVKYSKATSAESNGAHEHSVSAEGSYTPGGAISGSQTIADHTHTVTLSSDSEDVVTAIPVATGSEGAGSAANTDAAGAGTLTHTFTGAAATITVEGTAEGGSTSYQPAGTVSAVTAAAHSHDVDTHEHAANQTVLTSASSFVENGDDTFGQGSLPDLTITEKARMAQMASTATVNVVTGISGGTASGNETVNKGYTFTDTAFNDQVAVTGITNFNGGSATGTFNTDAIKGINGTQNYGFGAAVNNVMSAPTVSAGGVLSWTAVNAGTQDAHSGVAASTGSVGWTAATFTAATATVLKNVKTAGTITTAGTVNVVTGVNPATITATEKLTPLAIGSASGWSAGSLPTFTQGAKASFTAKTASVAGAASAKTVTSKTAGAINVTPTFTGTTATISIAGGAVTATGSYTPEGTINDHTLAAHSHGYIKPVAHTHSIAAATKATLTFATGVQSVSSAGGATVDFSKAAFAGAPATITVSGTAASAGAHTHSIATTLTVVSGTATATIAPHTHDIAGHSHSVTVPAIEA